MNVIKKRVHNIEILQFLRHAIPFEEILQFVFCHHEYFCFTNDRSSFIFIYIYSRKLKLLEFNLSHRKYDAT